MKYFSYLIIVLSFFVLFNNCNKSEETGIEPIEPEIEPIVDLYFTDLNDTTVFSHWACYESYFYLDIDKDSIDDVKIITFSSYSSGSGGSNRSYIEVTPLNGYEIAFSECVTSSWSWNPEIGTIYHIDTVLDPNVFQQEDSIFLEGDYTPAPIKLIYGRSPVDDEYSSGLHYHIEADTNFYMAFRKINGTNHKLAWLKVKSYGAYSITLNSCRYMENETFLIVE